MKGRAIKIALAGLGILTVVALARSVVIVDQTEAVYITDFGRSVRLIEKPGLHWKWPHQSRRGFDNRLQLDTPPPREMLTRDKKNLEVAWYVSWRITDVERFLRSIRTLPDASARLEDMAASVLAAELGGHDLVGLVRVGQESTLDAMMKAVTERVADQASKEYGLTIVDVRLRRLNYPEEVRSAVFEQIRSERKRVAAATRAEGESKARTIRSAADRKRAETVAEAEADAARVLGEGEAEATRIANDAHAADPAFYQFLKTLETYRSALDTRTTLVLSAESAFLRLLTKGVPDPELLTVGGPQAYRGPDDLHDRADGRGKAMRRWIGLALFLGLLAYLSTGLAVVQQDEVGVVRRFGAVFAEPWEPGLHWGFPWGIDRVERIKTGQTRAFTVGAQDLQAAPLARAPRPESDDFLTGDLNLVTAQAIVQYRVLDPVAYLFAARSVELVLAADAESALTRALVSRGIDDVLTTGRAEVGDQILRAVQARADFQGLGVSIRAVRLGRVAPPVAVAPAFADAARARSDLRQSLTRAEEYSDRALADSQGKAREIADRAAGQFNRRVQVAKGEADRFAKVLVESRKAPDATRRRLYLETLAELLPRFDRKVVVAPGQDLDVSLLASDPGSKTEAGPAGREPSVPSQGTER